MRPYLISVGTMVERARPLERAGQRQAQQIESRETARRADQLVDDAGIGRGELLEVPFQPVEVGVDGSSGAPSGRSTRTSSS